MSETMPVPLSEITPDDAPSVIVGPELAQKHPQLKVGAPVSRFELAAAEKNHLHGKSVQPLKENIDPVYQKWLRLRQQIQGRKDEIKARLSQEGNM
ncbi:hypothetical protein HYZ99_00135 [Candidatus Peregrinibacteria bacterium]|nr:hypothetical protein [Candidatus Peregrinibacteria bacterium]